MSSSPLHALVSAFRMAGAAIVGARMRRLQLPAWPVFALAEPDAPGWLCGMGEDKNGVQTIRLDYRPPFQAERLLVQTAFDDTAPDLSVVLACIAADDKDGEPLEIGRTEAGAAASGQRVTVSVDGTPTPGVAAHSGPASVWCVSTRGVVIIVASRSVPLDGLSLTQVRHLEPFKHARKDVIAAVVSGPLRRT